MKTIPQRIGGITGFTVNLFQKNDADVKSIAADINAEIEKGIANPESYPEAVEDAAELLKSTTTNHHVKEMIDAVADLAVHEPDESWFDEFGDAWSALSEGMKARRERRKAEKESESTSADETGSDDSNS